MADKVLKEKEEQLNMNDLLDFEARLQKQQQQKDAERDAYYKAKAERLGKSVEEVRGKRQHSSLEAAIYKAKTAAKKANSERHVEESFLHRTIRLIKGLSATGKKVREYGSLITHEKKVGLYLDVFNDAWKPVMDMLRGISVNLWEFLKDFWGDFVEIVFFFVNIIITISYYIGSFAIYIWDVIWDFRMWLDSRKRVVFQYFAASVTVIAAVLIFISSLMGYEYSYYGRVLGITRNKQEVYQTIEALGDKLSEASGANINIDVERDIEFSRVFGFNLDVDNADDILNTLTYMKDIQIRAFAINIDGAQTVILENEETANRVLQQVRDDYAGEKPGVVYTQVNYDQELAIEEVGVLLGDVWNPQDALRYLETGSAKPVEPEEAHSLITIHTVETATYDQQVKFGAKYINNSEIYDGETELISAGVYGTNEIVAEVTRINGTEQKRVVKSTTRTKNPVDAVYYMGTKPIPEKKGTGTFLWPIKNVTKGLITSRFGSRNTGIVGASTNHEGLDIGVPTGTKIYACDGGTVTFSGWRAGYGYVVIIDHGGLYETRYGHCSKLLVSAGEDVYQGQNIALVGSTGVSSGPHCHLEIRYNEKAYNPLNYLPAL